MPAWLSQELAIWIWTYMWHHVQEAWCAPSVRVYEVVRRLTFVIGTHCKISKLRNHTMSTFAFSECPKTYDSVAILPL